MDRIYVARMTQACPLNLRATHVNARLTMLQEMVNSLFPSGTKFEMTDVYLKAWVSPSEIGINLMMTRTSPPSRMK